MFLTKDELKELTGYEQPARQRKWLELRNWKFEMSAVGVPIVLRAYVEQRMGHDKPDVVPMPKATRNLDAFRKKPKVEKGKPQ